LLSKYILIRIERLELLKLLKKWAKPTAAYQTLKKDVTTTCSEKTCPKEEAVASLVDSMATSTLRKSSDNSSEMTELRKSLHKLFNRCMQGKEAWDGGWAVAWADLALRCLLLIWEGRGWHRLIWAVWVGEEVGKLHPTYKTLSI
jgi:hypothetical protein